MRRSLHGPRGRARTTSRATATSIGAFLIVFLIQLRQNRDNAVVQLKLDELIRRLEAARTSLVGLEHHSDEELAEVAQQLGRLRERHAGGGGTADSAELT